MKINFIFPGQGSQYSNMGKNLYNRFDYAKKIFNKSNDILNYDIKKICFSDENDKIHKTIYTQPAIFIYSMICDYYLKDLGYEPIAFAGHSLGEISAIVSSDCLDFEKALEIIKIRSEAMHKCSQEKEGKMIAVLSSNYSQLQKVINDNSNSIVIANYNSKKQTILSGENDEIDLISKIFKSNSIRTISLNVSGAFHSNLMISAEHLLKKHITKLNFRDISKPLYQNYNPSKQYNSNNIKHNLIKQITSPVKWIDIINNMYSDSINNFIEVGPGSTLTKLNKNINSDIICTNFNKLSMTL
tara:strand:+ start:30 stop:929 length:900 start_codon:yes stop_codon:yes gene_type:complete